MMIRFSWSDAESQAASTPVPWRVTAVIIATLFLNFPFWFAHGGDLWMSCPLSYYAMIVGGLTLLIVAAFFFGPAFATQAAGRPLFGAVEDSLGSIPAIAFRVCAAIFLTLWIADVIRGWYWLLGQILRENDSAAGVAVIVGPMLTFLVITGIQSPRISGRLALFTGKLAIAVLVAAFIRVHDGWPGLLQGDAGAVPNFWRGLSQLSFYVAPLALLAAGFAHRTEGRRQLIKAGLFGVALPLAGTLLFVAMVNVATGHSRFYQRSGAPSVAMALWAQTASIARPLRLVLVIMTGFGVVRFVLRALSESASLERLPAKWRFAAWGGMILALVWLSGYSYDDPFIKTFETISKFLTVASAVLTADYLCDRWPKTHRHKIDWIAVAALAAGMAVRYYVPDWIGGTDLDAWWDCWLLPSWTAAFLACMVGRIGQRCIGAWRPA